MLITSIGSSENELQAVFIKMHDWERLVIARKTIDNLTELGKKGLLLDCLTLF
jgi:hypothetical protein